MGRRNRWGIGLWLAALGLAWISPGVAREPVDEATYRVFLEFYQYDRDLPLNAQVLEVRDQGTFSVEKISFVSTHHETVYGYLILPKERPGPVSCVLFLHGYGGSKEDGLMAGALLAATGRACLALDAQYHGDRKREGVDIYSPFLYRDRDALIQTVVDWRRGIDYLETRPEIDPQRIGLIGGSMGAILGAVLTAVEPRVKVPVLVVGGADWGLMAEKSQLEAGIRLREARPNLDFDELARILAPVDPLHFAAHISPRPLLLQNGRFDNIVPVEANQRLYEVAREPKHIDWYDAGHDLPLDQVVPRITAWLDKYL
ncbi:MAG TPA: alpha/beta fold hydrolase [Armatimonadetes bacterium]|nr:alpha/beta fold hydrolase [Armatimonadota bacterium]